MTTTHIGSDFEDFLAEEGILEDAQAVAWKRVLAFQIQQAIEARGMSKAALARRMGTSRPALERLLDPENPSLTLRSLARVVGALQGELRWELVLPDATAAERG